MTKGDVILEAIDNGASDEDLLLLEQTDENEFAVNWTPWSLNTVLDTKVKKEKEEEVVEVEPELEPVVPKVPVVPITTETELVSEPEPKVEEKVKVLDFDKWHMNKGGEKTMVEKLQEIHGDDYEIQKAVLGDDVISIRKIGDKEGIQVRLQTSWTDNADHSRGYREYLNYVGGQDVDKTLNNYHDKTISKYKLTPVRGGLPESDEAFFERTKPVIKGGYTPYTEIGGIRYHSGVLPSVNGKRSTNPYRNANGGEATEQEKIMYEQMKFLHDLKERSDTRRAKKLSKEKVESDIVLQSKSKVGYEESLITDVGEKTTFTAVDYGGFVKEEAYEDFQEKALEIYAAEKVKGNEAVEKAISDFLPSAKNSVQKHFQPQYDALKAEQQSIIEKATPGAKIETTEHFKPQYEALKKEQDAIIQEKTPEVTAQLQNEINAGLWKHKSEEEINIMYISRLTSHLSGMQAKYDKVNKEANIYLNNLLNSSLSGMQAKYDKVNKEANIYLNDLYKKEQEDPESDFGIAINNITNNATNTIKAIEQEFFKTWKPEANLISEAKYEEISQELDKGGFANMNTNDKKLALTKQWNMLSDQLDDHMDPTELANAEKEFWSVNYSKLDKDKNGGFSQFIMKGVAQDQLGIINDAIGLEIEKIRSDYKKSPLRTAKEENKYIRRLAIESLVKKDPSFENYNQVERYLDKIINSPETMSDSGMVNFWRGLTSKQGHEYLPFVSGIVSTGDSYTIKKIADKDPKDRTEQEKSLLSIYQMKNETAAKVEEMSNAYNAGGMTADMLPFMGEMIATSGLAGVVGKATTTASRAFLFPKALAISGQTAVNVAEGASKTFGYIMGNLARTVVSPQRFMDQTYQNMTSEMGLMLSDEGTGLVAMVDENSGQSWETAFPRAFGSTWTEYVSEGLGEKLPGLSKYVRRRVFGDPEWMKRIAIGRYMRKMGLNKSEAVSSFLTKKVGYNGVFGEIAEEIINTPMQNLINGQEFGAGMDWDFYKELAISMSATGFVFAGGSLGYNAMKGNKQSSYFVEGKRFDTAAEHKKEVERMRDAGLLTANTDIEINNDFEAYDEISGITDSFGFKGLVKSQSGTSKAIQDKIAATELEVAEQIKNNNTPERSAELMKELEALELQSEQQQQQKDLIAFDEDISEETRVEEVKKLQQRIDNNKARRKAIIDPYMKRIEAKKKLKLYKQNVLNVQKRAEKLYGKEMPVIETNSTEEAEQELSIEFDQEISDLKAKLSIKKPGPSIPAIERADNEIRQQIQELEKQKADLLKGFDKVHGFITPGEINGKKVGQRIIINKNYALKAGAINVAGHEFFHNVLQATIRQNPETAIALGAALENVLKNLDPKQFRDSKLRARLKGYQVSEASMRKWAELETIENELGKDSPQWKAVNAALQGSRVQDAATAGEETLTLLSDALASGDLQYNETLFTRIGDAIRKALTAMGIRADFRDGRDVFNFVRDYNKTIASGKAFDKQQLRIIKEGATFGGELKESAADMKKQVEDFAPGARDVYFSKDDKVTEADIEEIAMNPETGERYTNEEWAREGINDAYMKLMYGDMLNGLMRNTGAKLQGDNVFNYPISEFFTELKQELDTAIMGFKPEDNNNFSGWIGFHVSKKKPGIIDKFKKRDAARKAKPDLPPTTSVVDVPGGIVIASRFGEVNPKTGKTTTQELVDKAINNNFRTHKDPKKYKEVKQAIVSVKKITRKDKAGKIIINKKTGKPQLFSPTKVDDVVPTGPLYPVLKIFAKEFGVDPRKILGNIALTEPERRKAQQALNKLGVRTTLQVMPEGFTENADATGMPTSILNAINPETGEPNLLYTTIGRKKNLDLQKKNNIDSINIAAAANVFGITQMGTVNRFDTENRLVDGPLRTVITQLATLAAGQSMVEQAEADGNFTRFAGIKDGKSGFAFSMDTLSDLDLDRRLEFLNKVDGVLSTLKPGFGKDISIPQVIDELKKAHGDLFTDREYKKIATEMKSLFDRYQPKTIPLPDIREEAWAEMIVDMKEDPLDNFLKFLGINEQATKIFDDEVNINKMRQSVSALGNHLLERGMTIEEVAQTMIALQPAYSGNTQISRKKNFTVVQDPTRSDYGHAFKISDEVKAKKIVEVDGVRVNVGGVMSSSRNQSFESIADFTEFGVMQINGMTDAVWNAARKRTKTRKQDAFTVLKNIDKNGSTNLKTEIEADAELGRTALDHMMDFLVQSESHDVLDVGMFLISNLSHMESPIRRSAMFTDVVEGLTDPKHENYVAPENRNKNTVVYEHSIPANEMAYRLAYYKLNNEWSNDFWDKYTVAVITKEMDDVLKDNGLQSRSNPGFVFKDPNSSQYDRYYGPLNYGEKAMLPIKNIFTGEITGEGVSKMNALIPKTASHKLSKDIGNIIQVARIGQAKPKGITVLDFDDTLATTKSLVKYTRPDGKTGTLNAEEYASTYEDLLGQGYTFDFTEFDKVVKGKIAPLFQKALKLQGKFGPENMFVLTARPPAAQKAIFDFLKANGLNIPIKNITGLGNSTAEAKALWIADKVGEGYNDFYFADDALQNVQAVKNMLNQFDVKSKVQQAKVKFSKDMNENFNDILENVTNIESEKRFSAIKARKRGADKGKFRFFIPPSHEDFVGLLYNFIGKGKEGNAHRDFFEQALIRPLNRAYRELNTAKQSIANDFKSLNKEFKDIKNILNEKIDGDFTVQDAIRVYLWDKHGHKIPGLSATDQQSLVEWVKSDSQTQAYAEALNIISKQDAYVNPIEGWEIGGIRADLDDATGRVGRADFFAEFNENSEIIFSEENLNKIEAAYGEDVVSAIKDILYRTKTGRNRPSGQNKTTNGFLNYLNGSVAATMFVNIRSMLLQQMSIVNFINYGDNNVLKAGLAFANQPQYYKDWAFIFNSDFMKQRRSGIKMDVNGAELAASLRGAKNTPIALLAKLLELGFLPTQIGDNFAIATGGATFYRNRINTYLKQGMTQKDAESKAWIDFQVLAEATQQSARPDMVSQQQASPLGKIILAFQNVTSQFNRLGKKAFLDLKNRRITPGNPTQLQSDVSNVSRIAYYFAIQNVIFYSLQTALFMAMFNDDEDEKRMLAKKERVINGTLDSILRGTGVWGAVISTIKNMAIAYHKEREKDWNGDEASVLVEGLNISPPLGIKARKIVNAERTLNYNKKVIEEMETFDIENPMWSAYTSYIEATTNIPLNRLYNKTLNVRQALNAKHEALQRALMFGGWSQWNLGIGDSDKIIEVKETIKKKKAIQSKVKSDKKREEKKIQTALENKAIIEENKKKSKKDGICSAVSKSGKRCKYKAIDGGFCTIHESTPQRTDGKKVQCTKEKADGERCGMKTTNKSGLCYYHD